MPSLEYSSASLLAPTLGDLLLGHRDRTTSTGNSFAANAALVVGASLFTAVLAQVSLPFVPVPITGQTLAVLLSGAVLGWKRGMLAQILYLAEGAVGLPVMANFSGGLPWLMGPTVGYAAMFPFAAALTGYLAQCRWDRSIPRTLLAMVLATALILAGGAAYLTRFVPASDVFAKGVLPFLPGDALKIALAALVLPATWRLMGRS